MTTKKFIENWSIEYTLKEIVIILSIKLNVKSNQKTNIVK